MALGASLLLAALAGLFTSPAVVSAGVIRDPLAEEALGRSEEIDAHTGNHCDDEKDGSKCFKSGVLHCQGERTASYTKCPVYQECKHGACQEDLCRDKRDGPHCHDGHAVQCAGGRGTGATKCGQYEECRAGACRDMCHDRADGSYCKDDHTLQCSGGKTVSSPTPCTFSQRCKESLFPGATCEEDDCVGKLPGTYCMHGGVAECRGGVGVNQSLTKCAFYQECSGGDQGAARCTEDACDDKPDGWHCKSSHRVKCAAFKTVEFEICALHTECNKVDGLADPVCDDGRGAASLDSAGWSARASSASAAVLLTATSALLHAL